MKRFVLKKVTVYRVYDTCKQAWHYSYGYVEEDNKEKMEKRCKELNELVEKLRTMHAKEYK